MTHRFKSVPLVPISSSIRADRDSQGSYQYDLNEVWEHELELSAKDRFTRPILVAALVALSSATVSYILTSTVEHFLHNSFAIRVFQFALFILGTLATICSFAACAREDFKFRLCMKALSDRQCAWQTLRIIGEREWPTFAVSSHAAELIRPTRLPVPKISQSPWMGLGQNAHACVVAPPGVILAVNIQHSVGNPDRDPI